MIRDMARISGAIAAHVVLLGAIYALAAASLALPDSWMIAAAAGVALAASYRAAAGFWAWVFGPVGEWPIMVESRCGPGDGGR